MLENNPDLRVIHRLVGTEEPIGNELHRNDCGKTLRRGYSLVSEHFDALQHAEIETLCEGCKRQVFVPKIIDHPAEPEGDQLV